MMTTAVRKSGAERREEILDAALEEFAEHGYHGGSTEGIARRAGISQPYVFRLFGTKQQLFKAVVARCFRETLEMFQRAAEGKRGQEALEAMGDAYVEQLTVDRTRLKLQMQAYAASEEAAISEVVRQGFGDLVAYAERVSGLEAKDVAAFFAKGMLLNVFASMGLFVGQADEPWAERLLLGCKEIG
jgi:AcrR family transcriptional regulator